METMKDGSIVPFLPSFLQNNSLTTDFGEKTEVFNIFLCKKDILLRMGKKIPELQVILTNNVLENMMFTYKDISSTIKSVCKKITTTTMIFFKLTD